MIIETLTSPNPRNRNSISVEKSKLLSVSSMDTLLAIFKVTDARRDVILAGPFSLSPATSKRLLRRLTVEPLGKDTSLIRTPLYYGQFPMSREILIYLIS